MKTNNKLIIHLIDHTVQDAWSLCTHGDDINHYTVTQIHHMHQHSDRQIDKYAHTHTQNVKHLIIELPLSLIRLLKQ